MKHFDMMMKLQTILEHLQSCEELLQHHNRGTKKTNKNENKTTFIWMQVQKTIKIFYTPAAQFVLLGAEIAGLNEKTTTTMSTHATSEQSQ